jgi:hypothetical protein
MKIPTYYLSLQEFTPAIQDRIGGTPTHLPECFPISSITKKELCFLMQLYNINVPGILCLQIYQSGELDEGDDPTPVVISVRKNAPINILNFGRPCSGLKISSILCSELSMEPDSWPKLSGISNDLLKLTSSKIGGLSPNCDIAECSQYLAQISESLSDFNFGGGQLMIYKNLNSCIAGALI